jgi:two-component system, NtrC family, sensor histidine kinase HydH
MSAVDGSLDFIKKTVRLSNSGIGFEDRLQGILDLLVRKEGVQKAILFGLNPEKDTLDVKKTSPKTSSFGPGPLSLPMTRGPLQEVIRNRTPLLIHHLNRRDHKPLLKNPLFKGFNSLIALPVEDDSVLYGVLTLLSGQTLTIDPGAMELFDLVSWELAGIIRNSKVYTESKKRIAELSVLYQVGKVIGSTLELDNLIERIVAITAQVINARGSVLVIIEKPSNTCIVKSEFGWVPSGVKEKILKDLMVDARDLTFDRASTSSAANPVDPPIKNENKAAAEKSPSPSLSIPLNFKGSYWGRLCVYEKMALGGEETADFNEDDLSLLSTLGNIVASSLENALTFQKIETLARRNEWMVKNLSTLYQIDSAMMTTSSLKDLSQIILEAITLEEGLGFNRAVLLMADEEKKFLFPMAWSIQMESGPAADSRRKDLSGSQLTSFLVNQASRIRNTRQETDKIFKDLKIPLTKDAGIISRTFLEGRIFLVERAQENSETNKNLAKQLNLDSFASIPVYAKDKVIGVIEVDNSLDKRPITEEDLYLLTMLANQAGLALENTRLYDFIEKTNDELKITREQLMESEKMVAIGEMASGLAHEIRNPLVSIGGFVRRLAKKFQGNGEARSYFQVIITEVERLEKTLNEIVDFSQNPREKYKDWDLNRIVEEALALIQRELDENKIKIHKEWGKIPEVFGDNRQLRHVFYNLFLNSSQAMPHGGVLTIRTFLDQGSERSWVICEIKDSGGGVPPELLHNIFNPFFTTKAQGSGLGLSIVHKIVTRHNGKVDIDNRPGEGVIFSVKLPLAREAHRYFQKIRISREENHETDINRR